MKILRKLEDFESREHTVKELRRYFIFLNKLRDSGFTNMYDSSSYLNVMFSLGERDARWVILSWVDSLDDNGVCVLPESGE